MAEVTEKVEEQGDSSLSRDLKERDQAQELARQRYSDKQNKGTNVNPSSLQGTKMPDNFGNKSERENKSNINEETEKRGVEQKDGGNKENTEQKQAEQLRQGRSADKKNSKPLKIEEKANKINRFKESTANLLRSAWMNIFPTFTLSAFWIYAHVMLSRIFDSFFCKIGYEWVPPNIRMSSPELAEKMRKKIAIVESAGIGCGCIIHFIFILVILVILLLTPPIVFIVAAIAGWEFLSSLW